MVCVFCLAGQVWIGDDSAPFAHKKNITQKINNRQVYLGGYSSEEDAAEVGWLASPKAQKQGPAAAVGAARRRHGTRRLKKTTPPHTRSSQTQQTHKNKQKAFDIVVLKTKGAASATNFDKVST